MQIPAIFHQFGQRIYSGVFDDVRSREELVGMLIGGFDDAQRIQLSQFLEELVSPRHSDAELVRTMNAVSTGYYFLKGDEVRALLKLTLAKL